MRTCAPAKHCNMHIKQMESNMKFIFFFLG